VNKINDKSVIYPGKKFVAKTGINRFNIIKIEAIAPPYDFVKSSLGQNT